MAESEKGHGAGQDQEQQTEKAHASPTKQFFISMITKDIGVSDCILDLLDNSIDGARVNKERVDTSLIGVARTAPTPDQPMEALVAAGIDEPETPPFNRYWVLINFSAERFSIRDNCGGISTEEAINYAFHFGRRRTPKDSPTGTIGLYGIGMKRAMLKMGRQIVVTSSTEKEAFRVSINVDEWATEKEDENSNTTEDWDFDLVRVDKGEVGTVMEITNLNKGMAEEFADTEFFNNLVRMIARDYSLFLQRGLVVKVNGETVRPYEFELLSGGEFEPIKYSYEDEGVMVAISAGLSKVPPDDDAAEATQPANVDYYGWFIACNDRIILAGNKDDRTVWGTSPDRFPGWHPQYNGFMGTASFSSSDPSLLPYTTTKRDVDPTMPVYRRAVAKMKAATRQYIDYSNARKPSLEEAKKLERVAELRSIASLPVRMTSKLPTFTKRHVANISYSVPHSHYMEVANALGDEHMSRKEVGLNTFKYFRDREVSRS